jgi:D-alanyl-D-alanine carboxypeptidase (penicillin-binding protein 5/6)
MNKYAKEIDLKQSSFGNPHGLPDFRNASTPYDLAILISNCMNIPLFCKVVNTKLYKLWVQNEGGKKEFIW